ncbi:MAG: response regulator [Planctomycetes bacterium]|nr:response regulator [Planctomycetota bacterium]
MSTILVVENDKNHLLLLKQELLLEGYNIVTAHDGCEALKKTNEHLPDLVIMDTYLPDMDCVELVEKIIYGHRKIPVIINTSFSGNKCRLIALLTDVDIVKKSSDLAELKCCINKFIDKKGFK